MTKNNRYIVLLNVVVSMQLIRVLLIGSMWYETYRGDVLQWCLIFGQYLALPTFGSFEATIKKKKDEKVHHCLPIYFSMRLASTIFDRKHNWIDLNWSICSSSINEDGTSR